MYLIINEMQLTFSTHRGKCISTKFQLKALIVSLHNYIKSFKYFEKILKQSSSNWKKRKWKGRWRKKEAI